MRRAQKSILEKGPGVLAMKRILMYLLTICLLLSTSACRITGEAEPGSAWTAQQMAEAIWASQNSEETVTTILPDDALYADYLAGNYGLDPAGVEDGAMLVAGGTSPLEVTVFLLGDADAAAEAAAALETYLDLRRAAFTGYFPEAAALLEQGQVLTRDRYVALLVCVDMAAAQAAFEQCFTQAPPVEPDGAPSASEHNAFAPSASPETPGTSSSLDWSYDEARLLDAWAAGDWSTLAPEDQAILDACQAVIAAEVPAGGTEYEKELAIHDWMIDWGSYDTNRLNQLPDYQENPNNDNPYGFLIDGKGICLGYTTTFQLFMDLLGIPCLTVEGTAYSGMEDHAWNQVQLDGEWYCVDVTWDDPVTRSPMSQWSVHRYFNVTSDFMRSSDHQWDESAVPEANGTAYAWSPQ